MVWGLVPHCIIVTRRLLIVSCCAVRGVLCVVVLSEALVQIKMKSVLAVVLLALIGCHAATDPCNGYSEPGKHQAGTLCGCDVVGFCVC